MLIGAKKMCRCFEYDTKTRNPLITAMLASRKTASSTLLTPTAQRGAAKATILLAKAHRGDERGARVGRTGRRPRSDPLV
jgi:hypothetical protein